MDEKDLRKMIFGSSFIEAETAFKNRVDELNDKYSYFLKKYQDPISGEKPFDLHNSYSIYNDRSQISIRILERLELPTDIINDLEAAFQATYGKR